MMDIIVSTRKIVKVQIKPSKGMGVSTKAKLSHPRGWAFPQHQEFQQDNSSQRNRAIQGDGRFHKNKIKPSKGMGVSTKPCRQMGASIKKGPIGLLGFREYENNV